MTAREWFERAQKEGWAIGAFNVDSLDIFKAVCQAGFKMHSPVMLEFSGGEVEYFGLDNIVDLVKNAKEEYKIPILLNLDHGKELDLCLEAVNLGGFDDVHFDGSDLSVEENIEGAKKVVEAAHAKNLLVEGEMDKVPGVSDVNSENLDLEAIKKGYSDPKAAFEFVSKTGVDIFASVFGNVHGTFPIEPELDFELLAEIRKALPDTFLSMHGGSGIAVEDVKRAIEVGKIVKVNVNTEIRQAYIEALGEKMGEEKREYTYYKIVPDVIAAVSAVVEGKMSVFGSIGKA